MIYMKSGKQSRQLDAWLGCSHEGFADKEEILWKPLAFVASRATIHAMIKSFRHKGLKAFFETGNKAGIRPDHAPRLARQLRQLNDATSPADMNMPGWRLHPLSDNLSGHWSVTVNGNWRMTFMFEATDAVLVDYQDYH